MTRWAVLPMMVLTLAAAPLRAEAVTLQEIIDLSRAGLGEEALLALIEIDPRVFPVDAASLQTLKKAGVSERVIIAVIKSGRAPAVMLEPEPFVEPQPDPPPPPQVVIVEREPVVREVVVPIAVPIYVPVTRSYNRDFRDEDDRRFRKTAEPVYWGFGGKLRPDAWTPAPTRSEKAGQPSSTSTSSNRRP